MLSRRESSSRSGPVMHRADQLPLRRLCLESLRRAVVRPLQRTVEQVECRHGCRTKCTTDDGLVDALRPHAFRRYDDDDVRLIVRGNASIGRTQRPRSPWSFFLSARHAIGTAEGERVKNIEAQARRSVVVLGATGAVGQRFVHWLSDHPWFEIAGLGASERSAGHAYGEACRWVLCEEQPGHVSAMPVAGLDPSEFRTTGARMPIAFSALPADIAADVEPRFAAAGYAVFSNASAFRYEPDVPILVPEVNPEHHAVIEVQRAARGWSGFIVTNPNCTTAGMSLVLKPLDDAFGLRRVSATTMQAVSGAGYPGVASLDILDNVLPLIPGEEEKMAQETRLLLGRFDGTTIAEAPIVMSAQANRVPVIDAHTVSLSLGFDRTPTPDEAARVLEGFRAPELVLGLPSAPDRPVRVFDLPDRPQPRFDRHAGRGMATCVGRIRSCPILGLRLVLVAHNTIRGAAGGSVLNAELLVRAGVVA